MTREEALKIRKCNGLGYSYVDFIKALQILEPGEAVTSQEKPNNEIKEK